MIVIYNSKTGKTKEFAIKVSPYATSTQNYVENDKDILLITYTTGVGQVPKEVKEFIEKYGSKIKAVVATGNKEKHPDTFAFAGDKISKQLNIPLLLKVQLNGTNDDVLEVIRYINAQKNKKKEEEIKNLECSCPINCPIHIECACDDL